MQTVLVRYGPIDALAHGVSQTWDLCAFSLRMIGKMLSGEVSLKNISGPVTIADYAGQSARLGPLAFISFIAFISISLGVMNLLPIPMLDGGHLLYYSAEIVRGRPPSERFLEWSQRAGMFLLAGADGRGAVQRLHAAPVLIARRAGRVVTSAARGHPLIAFPSPPRNASSDPASLDDENTFVASGVAVRSVPGDRVVDARVAVGPVADRGLRRALLRPLVIASALAGGFVATGAAAVEPFVVRDIRVEGVQRTEPGTVFSYLPVKVGETFNDEKATAALKALYATGFFKDVRIDVDKRRAGGRRSRSGRRSPSVDFTGTEGVRQANLKKALKDIGLSETAIFDRSILDRAEQELKRQYLTRGKYGAQVTTTVTPLERNRVNITFNVDEGDAATIKQIHIVGNTASPRSELLGEIALTTPGWFTWYTKTDQYSKAKLDDRRRVAARVLSRTAAISSSTSSRRRCRSRPTRRTSTSRSTSARASAIRCPTSRSPARRWSPRRSCASCCS